MSETIYESDFSKYLPQALSNDPKIAALAKAATKELLAVSGKMENVLIYTRIDELPEELLDILAYDMHVDWYDYSYPLDVKRNIIKNSVSIHKKIGTKYAVEKALSDVYRSAKVVEWFEYEGGQPYHFKINVDVGDMGIGEKTTRAIEEKMWFYKNLRSHCDGIFYAISIAPASVKAAGVHEMGTRLKIKPLLRNSIKAAGQNDIRAATRFGAVLKVKPILPASAASSGNSTAEAVLSVKNTLKVKTYTESELKADLAANGSAGAYFRSKQTMTIRKE